MRKKFVFTISLLVFISLFSFFIFDFDKSDSILVSEEKSPAHAPVEENLPVTAWHEFYRLDYLGLDLKPSHLSYDQLNDRLAIFDVNQQKLVLLNLDKKNYTVLDLPALSSSITWSQGQLYLYAQALYRYHFAPARWEKISPDFDFTTPVTQFSKFGDNYYLFGENLLRKVSYSDKNQYLGLESWFENDVNPDFNPFSILIDGHIFIIDQSGQINRYLRGELTNWRVKDLDILGPSYLDTDYQSYYCLSPYHHSLFTLDLAGNIINQHQDDLLNQAQFLWFDSKQKIFYTIVNQIIYAFLPQKI